MAPAPRGELGKLGEDEAASYLKDAGYRILARGYRCKFGEIDVIALRKGTAVFVEVKARSGDALADPEDAVGVRRQRRLAGAAGHYLATRDRGGRLDWRFDVIGVLVRGDGEPEIRHTEGAFDPGQIPPARGRR